MKAPTFEETCKRFGLNPADIPEPMVPFIQVMGVSQAETAQTLHGICFDIPRTVIVAHCEERATYYDSLTDEDVKVPDYLGGVPNVRAQHVTKQRRLFQEQARRFRFTAQYLPKDATVVRLHQHDAQALELVPPQYVEIPLR